MSFKSNKKIFFLVLFILLTFNNCLIKNQKNKLIIEVRFLTCSLFSSKNPTAVCGSYFLKNYKTILIDTLYINSKEFDSIYYYFKKNLIQEVPNNFNITDFQIKIDSQIYCTDELIRIINDNFGNTYKPNLKILYKLRQFSNYYNYKDTTDLKYFEELKLYGLPKNYKLSPPQYLNGLPLFVHGAVLIRKSD